jgi:tetratricopeptide (TPR) repeat protein
MGQSIALSLLLVAFAAGRAGADDGKLARQHFEDGSRLYDLGKFSDAARQYEEAYKYKPDPALLFNIGQAYRAAGDVNAALTAYKSYLRRVPNASNRQEVETHIAKLQKLVEAKSPPQETRPPIESAPPPTPPPIVTPPPTVTPPTLVMTTTAAPAGKKPLYKKWWLWTAIGGVIVAGGVVAIAVAATTPKDASSPANTFGVSLH